jgi:hypothetical protein
LTGGGICACALAAPSAQLIVKIASHNPSLRGFKACDFAVIFDISHYKVLHTTVTLKDTCLPNCYQYFIKP